MVRTTSIEIEKLARGAFAALGLVPAEGYRWITEEGERWLQEGQSAWHHPQLYEFARPALRKSYREDPGLHRYFAKLKETEDDIERFANKYGRLWGPMGSLEALGEIRPRAIKSRESLGEWSSEIREMARLLRLWDQARIGDNEGLRAAVTWRQGPRRVYVEKEIFASEGLSPERTPLKPSRNLVAPAEGEEPLRPRLIEAWEYGDLVRPARFYVAARVNETLLGHVSPAVVPFAGPSEDGQVLFFPDSLHGALYALFALEITNYGFTRTCHRCSGEFRTTNRKKFYCSDACKKADWENKGRRRKVPSSNAEGEPATADRRPSPSQPSTTSSDSGESRGRPE
jgi:hypothetical protein